MLIRSISLPVKELNTCATTSVSSATERDATHPNIRNIPKEEENPLNKEHDPCGGQKLEKLMETCGSPTSWNRKTSLWSKPLTSWETTTLKNLLQPRMALKMNWWLWSQPLQRVFEREGWISIIASHRHSVHTCINICLSNHYPCDSVQDGKWKNCWNHCSDWQWDNNLLHWPSPSQKDEMAIGETP